MLQRSSDEETRKFGCHYDFQYHLKLRPLTSIMIAMRYNGDKWTALRYTGLAAAAAGLNCSSDKPKGSLINSESSDTRTLVKICAGVLRTWHECLMFLASSHKYNYTGLAAEVTQRLLRNEIQFGEANQITSVYQGSASRISD